MKETSNQPNNQNCFNTALLLSVPKSDSPSLSPNQIDNPPSLHNYLPFDLLSRIETISPAERDQSPTSQRMSDIELKSNEDKKSTSSYNEDNDDIVLNQYEYDELGNEMTQPGSLTTNHKSSTGSNNSTNSASMIERMKLNFMNNYNNTNSGRKLSLPIWVPQNTLMTYGVNNNVSNNNMKQKKKKSKKKKKKEKDEFTIEMFGRRGWICEQCNNFNYDSRHKCNRCGLPEQPKVINSSLNLVNLNNGNENDGHKGDWCCKNCNNLNYAFRLVCNRCQMPKGDNSKVSPSS